MDKKFITLTNHNKYTQKITKSLKKKLEYNIADTTNNTLQRNLTNKTIHNTKHETNFNVMCVPNSILVKQVDLSKRDKH